MILGKGIPILSLALAYCLRSPTTAAFNLQNNGPTAIAVLGTSKNRASSSFSSSSLLGVATPIPLELPSTIPHQPLIPEGSLLTPPPPPRTKRQQQQPKRRLDPKDEWIETLNYEAFAKDVNDLGKSLLRETGQDDVVHLEKILRWRDMACILGISTMWMAPNVFTVMALSLWTYSSWTMVAHHTCHGGYNRVDAGKYNSRGFALNTLPRRIADWCDWMLPEAWNIEHNRLHHYHLGEPLDPDLVERNLEFLREGDISMPVRYLITLGMMPVWKWFYYAPNTFKELQIAKYKSENGGVLPNENLRPEEAFTVRTLLVPKSDSEKAMLEVVKPMEFLSKVFAPFLLSRFVLLPSPLLLIPHFGSTLFLHAITNLILADLLTNIHGFITIVTNHAGDDLYKFDDEVKPKTGSFYVRQIVSSSNYDYGSDIIDFGHGWLNYQIEHHCWPDLSMLAYQRGAPRLKAICEAHGVPYVQENVLVRLRKTLDIMVGKSSMREFPTELEPVGDKASRGVQWKSTNGAIDDDDMEEEE